MNIPEEDPFCVEIAISPDEDGVPFSPSGLLYLRATVRACGARFMRRALT